MIKTIFFDVGGTLIRPHPSVGAIYSEVAKRHKVNLPADVLEERFHAVWKIQKKEWKDVVRLVFQDSVFPNFDHFFSDLYKSFEDTNRWHIFPDVFPTLSQLKVKGVRLAIASNWDERLPALLEKLSLASFFENQFVSFSMNINKPDPTFFLKALEAMGEFPIQAMHVGDDASEDVACAEAAGLRAYLIDRKRKPLNSRMLSSLEDLLLRV